MTAISAENLPFSTFLPEHAEPAIDTELAAAQARLDAIVSYAARRDPHASLSMMKALAPEIFDGEPWGEPSLHVH